ncbi:regulator of sigma E protease [Paucidesulfovibrio gracilis DSM 16080]|uniref:Zinc metalloprotease n=1 Tax=Paucidesulfovibrio gracilis DSM 16080 TaxID=1121449 RepID=A0A1T4WCC6_9BACT|nr:RIP metalloprotease RseP [Paucidesulfovibrio gracilis]SKA74940.1 regulator of sigma E protease [Paucidesulfovibrio gracilis DSM 16080]
MTSTIAVILVLGGLIFFHELGHFLMARVLGMGVKSFSLGFGPVLFKRTMGQTEYRLSALPLGGYVSLAGESQETVDEDTDFPEDQRFMLRPAWQRLLVVLAGPVFNFVLGWFIYWGLFLSQGQVTLYQFPVQEVFDDSPAQMAGMEPGDRIIGIDGEAIYSPNDLLTTILFSRENPVRLSVVRGGVNHEFLVLPTFLNEEDKNDEILPRPKIGVSFGVEPLERSLGWDLGTGAALGKTISSIEMTAKSFLMIVEGRASLKGVGGPIMIAQAVGKHARAGLVDVLLLAAFISINLGILNLLPIPVLDGGHILFFGFEAVTGRPVNDMVRQFATYVGLTFLLGLMALTFYNDIHRILFS